MGGNSSEFDISVRSGIQVSSQIDTSLFQVFPILIKGSNWCYTTDNHKNIQIDKNDFSLTLREKKTTFDCVFNVIHGSPGEDGRLQGYFDMLSVPYTSSGVFCSALAFNKFATLRFLENFKIRSAKSVLIRNSQDVDHNSIIATTGLPCFVKPNNGGSSFGASKVLTITELKPAIENAIKENAEVIIEEYIEGRELTCGVFTTRKGADYLPITEIVSANVFFDYEAKYTHGLADEICPANIEKSISEKCQKLSLRINELLGCSGFVRMDYILKDNELYFLEVNTVPGMTKESIMPKMLKAAGIDSKIFFTDILLHTIQNAKL